MSKASHLSTVTRGFPEETILFSVGFIGLFFITQHQLPVHAIIFAATCAIPLCARRFAHPELWRTLIAGGYAILLVIVLLSLNSSEHRGTHRFIPVLGIRINIATPFSVLAILVSALFRPRTSLCLMAISVLLLIATRSYSTAAVLAVANAIVVAPRSPRNAVFVTVLLGSAILLATMANPNRLHRVQEFWLSPTTAYQSSQLALAWDSSRLIGSSRYSDAHLPCASTDLVLADIARSHGLIAGLMLLASQTTVVWALCNLSLYGSGPLRQLPLFAASYYTVSICAHSFVNIGWLPPTGVPMPFLGDGRAAYTSWCILIAAAFGSVHRSNELPCREAPFLIVKYLLLAACVSTHIAVAGRGISSMSYMS